MQVVDDARYLVFECPGLDRLGAAGAHLSNMSKSVGKYVGLHDSISINFYIRLKRAERGVLRYIRICHKSIYTCMP